LVKVVDVVEVEGVASDVEVLPVEVVVWVVSVTVVDVAVVDVLIDVVVVVACCNAVSRLRLAAQLLLWDVSAIFSQ
jgi:hypothetical protein